MTGFAAFLWLNLSLKSLCYGEWQEEGIRVVCVNIIFPIRGISVKNTNKYINTIK
jgi:hypothetical protein